MAGKASATARSADRLPPGQRQVHNFPVLDLGIQPEVSLDKWELKIHGHVENPVTLNWTQFLALPLFRDLSDFHCVTTWSQVDMAWEGVAFFTLAVREIIFLDRDLLGFWELRGYSNTADPRSEERFANP